MKILVTGARGFLGGRLIESLLRHGHRDIRLHYRRQSNADSLDSLQQQYPETRLQVVGADLLRPSQLPALVEGVDLIIHGAAAKRGATADMFLNTVVGTRNLLDAAVNAGRPRIALVSSFAAFRSSQLNVGAVLDEQCGIETDGVEKGSYGFVKVQQELLFRRYQAVQGFEYVVLRPGVIYGPGDSAFSSRVGLKVGPLFFSLGGRCLLPLTYVDNCADAIVMAALKADSGTDFSVVDDDLPTCNEYLAQYQQQVGKLRTVTVPHWAFGLGIRFMTAYNRRSQGQLPAVFTSLIFKSMYRRLRYSNAALKKIGWQQQVSTKAGMERTFTALRNLQSVPAR